MSTTANSKMFLRVSPNSFNPVMGGFIILQDHKPRGPYKEVIFRQQAYPLTPVVFSGSGATKTTVTFKRGADIIASKNTYAANVTPETLTPLLNTDFPYIGIFTLNTDTGQIEISDPIHKDLVVTAVYS